MEIQDAQDYLDQVDLASLTGQLDDFSAAIDGILDQFDGSVVGPTLADLDEIQNATRALNESFSHPLNVRCAVRRATIVGPPCLPVRRSSYASCVSSHASRLSLAPQQRLRTTNWWPTCKAS